MLKGILGKGVLGDRETRLNHRQTDTDTCPNCICQHIEDYPIIYHCCYWMSVDVNSPMRAPSVRLEERLWVDGIIRSRVTSGLIP